MDDSIRVAKALIRLARILVAYKPNGGRRVSDDFAVNKRYVNFTGEFRHPMMYGFWGDVKDATFTVDRKGLDWEKGTWTRGTWKDGTWRDGTWSNGKWEAGTWKGGMWLGGTDRHGTHHKGGDSPDKWKTSRKKGDIYNPTLYDLFGEDALELDDDDRDLINRLFGDGASHSPYRDLTPQDLFGPDAEPVSSGRKREPTLDDLLGTGKPKEQPKPAEPMRSVLVDTRHRSNRNSEAWELTKPSTNNHWYWYLPAGLTKFDDIMAGFEAAINKRDHQRIRATWDTFMDDDDKYSVRDEDGNVLYTFEKVQ